MGGRIWVESVIGKGSVLSFAAPFETPAGPLWRVGVPVGTAPERPLLPLRILLAEDSPDNRTITLAYWRARRSRLKSPRPEPSPVECLKQDTTISF